MGDPASCLPVALAQPGFIPVLTPYRATTRKLKNQREEQGTLSARLHHSRHSRGILATPFPHMGTLSSKEARQYEWLMGKAGSGANISPKPESIQRDPTTATD